MPTETMALEEQAFEVETVKVPPMIPMAVPLLQKSEFKSVTFHETVTVEVKFLLMVCGPLEALGYGVGSKSKAVTEKLGEESTQEAPVMVTAPVSLPE